MKKTNLHEAKSNLSKLVELATKGEEIIICKAGIPVAKLVSLHNKRAVRKPGIWAGKVTIEKDFDELPKEFLDYFK